MSQFRALETPASKPCAILECRRRARAKGLCSLHLDRMYRTGTTADPAPRSGVLNPAWRGDKAGYSAVHLRLTNRKRPAACAHCGITEGRFEWALGKDVPPWLVLQSKDGYAYTADLSWYVNLCKACHNKMDLGRDQCKRGHDLEGDNLYIQPSNGKRFCRECNRIRRRARYVAARSARFEHGECG